MLPLPRPSLRSSLGARGCAASWGTPSVVARHLLRCSAGTILATIKNCAKRMARYLLIKKHANRMARHLLMKNRATQLACYLLRSTFVPTDSSYALRTAAARSQISLVLRTAACVARIGVPQLLLGWRHIPLGTSFALIKNSANQLTLESCSIRQLPFFAKGDEPLPVPAHS